jgi:hypothetical protein
MAFVAVITLLDMTLSSKWQKRAEKCQTEAFEQRNRSKIIENKILG